MDMELLRNGSGYVDYTAYKALSNYERTEKEMLAKINNESRNGEIWKVSTSSRTEKEILIIQDRGNYVVGLVLNDNFFIGAITIRSIAEKYTDPGKVSYYFDDRLETYVKTITSSEYEKVMDVVSDALGLKYNGGNETEAVEPVEYDESKTTELPFPAPAQEDNYIRITFEEFESMAKANTEKDIYKGLYEQLLAKLIKD